MSSNSGKYVVIKTANGTAKDIRILCVENWRVFDLKVHLSAQHPLHPPVRGQKLIHSGKLLSDETIVDTLVPGNKEFVLHLVISPAYLRSNSIPARNPSHDQERPVVPPADATPTNSTAYNENQQPRPNQFPNNPWLHYRPQMMPGNPNEQYPRPFPTNWPHPYMMNFSPYYAAQMAHWYHTLYHGQLQGGIVHNNQDVNNRLPANNLEQDGRGGGPEEPELQDDLAMNGGGGFALMADNRRPRDLVDYGYMFMMLLFLGMIGYLTGSLYQFIIFFAGVAIILMNQGGWFRVQRRVITDLPQQPAQREQDQVDNGDERDVPGDNNQPEEEMVGPPQEQVQPPRQGFLATIIVFVTSFFTSLFPQQIPELQAN